VAVRAIFGRARGLVVLLPQQGLIDVLEGLQINSDIVRRAFASSSATHCVGPGHTGRPSRSLNSPNWYLRSRGLVASSRTGPCAEYVIA
jgi:hypothetical protein